MFVLKLTLLTLLMIAPGLLVYADTSVTCEGNDAELICEAGVLNILSANYGRTDNTTCSAGRPSNQTTKTDCYGTNPLFEVTNRCEGKSSCVVPVTNSVFSDPCFGTYKYLSIKYSCVVHYTSVTCEGNDAELTCEAGVLNILSANYGRTDNTTCSAGRPISQTTKTDCYGTNILFEVTNRCEGKSSCVVPATNTVFSDPCFGTYKYLSIKYSCVVQHTSVTCEGNDAELTCEAGVLNILSTNYGRTDNTTCSAGRPSNQTTKTDCYGTNIGFEVTNRCEGKSSCVVPVTNSVFSDPCFGTYKYLSITYSCVVHYTSVTCEGNNAVLTCEAGVLNILRANYGRTDSTTCSAGRPSNQTTNTNCYGSKTMFEVTNRCGGKSRCVVPATISVFSDPCYGTYKYLSIKYSCVVH
ncbi:rhamnose-binding lectin-like isoform X2 [Brachyhypopomus gauderio]|uniref:rhamnose-binding lectin-like isoform X1 n=1 Tax=Brachyhypopomus gauderio TaxID=698409 RepID=UPI004043900A